MRKKKKINPVENYSDIGITLQEVETGVGKEAVSQTAPWGSENSTAVINRKVDPALAAAAWYHEMSVRGMTQDEVRYVELMIIELAKFYFTDFEARNPSKKCRDALEHICESFSQAERSDRGDKNINDCYG